MKLASNTAFVVVVVAAVGVVVAVVKVMRLFDGSSCTLTS